MCPLYPLHLVITYGFLILLTWMLIGPCFVQSLNHSILPLEVKLEVNGSLVQVVNVVELQTVEVDFYIDDLPPKGRLKGVEVEESSEDGLHHISPSAALYKSSDEGDVVEGKFNVTGEMRGFSAIKLVLNYGNEEDMMQTKTAPVQVKRGNRAIEKIFVHVVILLVVFAYINMGCAIDLNVIKETLRRPIAPAIGIASQYLFMPLLSYFLGMLFFSSNPALWLGLFLTGCSPGGGGSNMWTLLLGGSLDLSITMTFLSTLLAFGTMPLWIFALARHIFADGTYGRLPYRNLFMLILGLIIPCGIGLLIKRFLPRVAAFLRKLLRPIAIIFIIFIMTFGVYANLYIFSFFTWQVALSGFCLPFFGYLFGFGFSSLLNRPWEEIVAISIETGLQNSGMAIAVIKIALHDLTPLDDVAIVIPIAVATMTPIPLTIVYLVQRVKQCLSKRKNKDKLNGSQKEIMDGADLHGYYDASSKHSLNLSNDIHEEYVRTYT